MPGFDLTISGCFFPAEMPDSVLKGEDEKAERRYLARECLESITRHPFSASLAGCPDTSSTLTIAEWAVVYVSAFYDINTQDLLFSWRRHYGPVSDQIMLNPALSEAVFAVLSEAE